MKAIQSFYLFISKSKVYKIFCVYNHLKLVTIIYKYNYNILNAWHVLPKNGLIRSHIDRDQMVYLRES